MAVNFERIASGVTYVPQASDPSSPTNGAFYYNSSINAFKGYAGGWDSFITTASTNTLTNKTLQGPDGSVSAPTYSFGSDTTSGMYKATGELDFSVGSTNVLKLTSATIQAEVAIVALQGTVSAPGYTFGSRTDVGFYSSGGHLLDVASNGVQVFEFSSTTVQNFVPAVGSISSSGTSFTNFSNGFNTVNSSGTVNTWAGYNFYSTGTTTSNGVIAVQTTDTTNHYGLMALGVRSAAGYLAEIQITGDALTLGNSSSSAITINSTTGTNGSGGLTLTNAPSGVSGNPTGYLQLTINGGTHYMPYW